MASNIARRLTRARLPSPCWARPLRAFSTAGPLRIRTVDMRDSDIAELTVDQDRMMNDLHRTCEFGTGKRWGSGETETGMARLALSDADKQARDWFVRTTEALGCRVTVDQMGNIFAVRPGRRGAGAAPIFAGSHLDTQPAAGRYDGILGVHAGVEMLRVLRDRGVETEHPVGVVNWTNEEGARFPITMMSSGVWAGATGVERAHACREVGAGGATVRSELERIGYLGSTPASHESTPMAAHFELHIEQGPILEAAGQRIGVVEGVQAYKWFTIDVQGRAAHTGTTPFSARSDALLMAARLIARSNRVAAGLGALATTGVLALEPGSTNTVPERVRFSLDVRAPRDEAVEAVERQLRSDFAAMARGEDYGDDDAGGGRGGGGGVTPPARPLAVEWTTDAVSPATRFHEDCVACVREAAASVLQSEEEEKGRVEAAAGSGSGAGDGSNTSTSSTSLHRGMTSGAGHDTVHASRRCPAAMVFVPSRGGVSHHPEEWTSAADCALGARVLCQAVVRYDRLAASRL